MKATLTNHLKKFSSCLEREQLIIPGKKLFVLYSGGKDSTALVTLLEEYKKEHPETQPIYLNVLYPPSTYGTNPEGRQLIIGKGLEHYHPIKPATTKEELQEAEHPCQHCKDVRANAIAEALKDEQPENITIMTGHTHDDAYAYFAEITGLNLRAAIDTPKYDELGVIDLTLEHLEHFSRLFPKLTLHDGATLTKPLLSFTNKEIEGILAAANKQWHTTTCLYSHERPKRNLFHAIKLLPEEEATRIYEATNPEKLLATIKEKAHNYAWAMDAIKHKPYKSLLL